MDQAILALLALLTLIVAWAALEVRGLKLAIGPLAESPAARAIAGLGT